jgi:hypothetical protein
MSINLLEEAEKKWGNERVTLRFDVDIGEMQRQYVEKMRVARRRIMEKYRPFTPAYW